MQYIDSNVIGIDEKIKADNNAEKEYNEFFVDHQNREIGTPKDLVGFVKNMIKNMLIDIGRCDIETDIIFNEEKTRTSPAYVLVQRGEVSGANLAIPGGAFSLNNTIATDSEKVNQNETMVGSHLLQTNLTIKTYSTNRAELEDISYKIYLLLLSLSDTNIQLFFSNIKKTMEPILTSINQEDGYQNMYSTQIMWQILFIENDILLFKKNLIKYFRTNIKEKRIKDVKY